jgi:predicted nucleic acid-binding protein
MCSSGLAQPHSAAYGMIRQSIELLWRQGADLFSTSQNMAEFWNVCTRPTGNNGFGSTVAETDVLAGLIEGQFTLAPDSEETHRAWRRIVVADQVSGVQVHDARLVAAMQVHGITHLLTLNVSDFRRFQNVDVVSPRQLMARSQP